MLLSPGAGGSADSPQLIALADGLAAATGVVVERMDFPYRLAGRRRPDPPSTLEASVRERACALARRLGVETDELVLGGRSMGGRICSVVVSRGFAAAGLVLISYPLHPAGRREPLRTSHFAHLGVPCIFVSGTRDAFAAPEELEDATAAIPGPVTHVWLQGGDHGLRRHGPDVVEAVARWLVTTFATPASD